MDNFDIIADELNTNFNAESSDFNSIELYEYLTDRNPVEELASSSVVDTIQEGIVDDILIVHSIRLIINNVYQVEDNNIYLFEYSYTENNTILHAFIDTIQLTQILSVIPEGLRPSIGTIELVITNEPSSQKLPENSPTLLIDETTSRFSSAIWYEKIQEKVILLAGVGGIGSYIAFLLGRLKPNAIYIYDNDTVETVNMAGQLYGTRHIGIHKVDAITDIIKEFTDYNSVFAIPSRFNYDSEATDIMICGFDNMASRMLFFDKWLTHVSHKEGKEEKAKCLFIDGRLAAEEFQIFCIKGDDIFNTQRYAKEFLFPDSEAEETMCSYKQTTFCANMIASFIVNLFVNFCANECGPIIDRDLPFLTTYNAETMYFKTEI